MKIKIISVKEIFRIKNLINFSSFYRTYSGLNKNKMIEYFFEEEKNKSEKDNMLIVAEEKNKIKGAIGIEYLPFDSEVFKIKMARIKYLIGIEKKIYNDLVSSAIKLSKENKIKHLSCRVDVYNPLTIHSLENCGFFLMDVILTFAFDFRCNKNLNFIKSNDNVKIENVKQKDIPLLMEISRKIFDNGRFHSDPHINNTLANEIYAKWLKNDCLGRVENVLVAYFNSKPVGFIACGVNRKFNEFVKDIKFGYIDLVGVDREYHNKGIGKKLVSSALNYFKNYVDIVEVGAMANNFSALKLYQTCNFKVVTSRICLHKWLGENNEKSIYYR